MIWSFTEICQWHCVWLVEKWRDDWRDWMDDRVWFHLMNSFMSVFHFMVYDRQHERLILLSDSFCESGVSFTEGRASVLQLICWFLFDLHSVLTLKNREMKGALMSAAVWKVTLNMILCSPAADSVPAYRTCKSSAEGVGSKITWIWIVCLLWRKHVDWTLFWGLNEFSFHLLLSVLFESTQLHRREEELQQELQDFNHFYIKLDDFIEMWMIRSRTFIMDLLKDHQNLVKDPLNLVKNSWILPFTLTTNTRCSLE